MSTSPATVTAWEATCHLGPRGHEVDCMERAVQARAQLPPGLARCESQFGVTTVEWVSGLPVVPTKEYDGADKCDPIYRRGPCGSVRPRDERPFLLHVPPWLMSREHDRTVPLVVFAHGARGSAWHHALHRTRWIEKAHRDGFVVAFAQAEGAPFPGSGSPRLGGSVCASGSGWGEYYFEVRSHTPQFERDLAYMRTIPARVAELLRSRRRRCASGSGAEEDKDDDDDDEAAAAAAAAAAAVRGPLQRAVVIDATRTFFVGHSNGGVFSCHVALRLAPQVYARVINCMGGVGWDPGNHIDFSWSSGDNSRSSMRGRPTATATAAYEDSRDHNKDNDDDGSHNPSSGGSGGGGGGVAEGACTASADAVSRPALLLITGDRDDYRVPVHAAAALFECEGFPVRPVVELPDQPHDYPPQAEDAMVAFLLSGNGERASERARR